MTSILGPPTMKIVELGFVSGAKASFSVVIDGDYVMH
jgi:hypothetical protein